MFWHSYLTWMDKTHAPITVQKELMQQESMQNTMNVYGKAMTDDKQQTQGMVVGMITRPKETR